MNKVKHQKLAKKLFFRDEQFLSARVQYCKEDISWLNNYRGDTNSERVWNLFNDRPRCACGNLTSYINFTEGYRASCSQSCGQKTITTFKKEQQKSLWSDSAWKAETSSKMKEAHFKSRTPGKLQRLRDEKDIVCLDELTPGQDNEYRWQHKCGEVFVRPFKRLAGIYCPKCHVSKGQGELYEFIRRNYSGRIIVNDRHQLWPKEIDIYLPDIKVGFEFNGKYWHQGDGFREAVKVFEANEVGVKLINVWETEWNKDRAKVRVEVLNALQT